MGLESLKLKETFMKAVSSFLSRMVFLLLTFLVQGIEANESQDAAAKGASATGRSLTIEGDHFTGASGVRLNGQPTTFTVESDQVIHATLPPTVKGNVVGVVDTPQGAVEFTIHVDTVADNAPKTPIVRAVRPEFASSAGGSEVDIIGDHFSPDQLPKFLFDASPSPKVTYVSANQLKVIVPAHAPGQVSVVMDVDHGAKLPVTGGFEYRNALRLDGLSLKSASIRGGMTLTLNGVGFSPQGQITVKFDETLAEILEVTKDQRLVVRVPAHPEGDVDVVVENADHQTAKLEKAFHYIGEPSIKGVKVQ